MLFPQHLLICYLHISVAEAWSRLSEGPPTTVFHSKHFYYPNDFMYHHCSRLAIWTAAVNRDALCRHLFP